MSLLERADNFLFAQATKFAHAVQRLTGLTTYFIAKLGVGVVAISIIIDILNYFYQFLTFKTYGWAAAVNLIGVVLVISWSRTLQKAEDCLGDAIKPAELGTLMVRGALWRKIYLFVFVMALIGYCVHPGKFVVLQFWDSPGFPLGMLIFTYFLAVDPLPPGRSKVREWLESLTFMPELARQKSQK